MISHSTWLALLEPTRQHKAEVWLAQRTGHNRYCPLIRAFKDFRGASFIRCSSGGAELTRGTHIVPAQRHTAYRARRAPPYVRRLNGGQCPLIYLNTSLLSTWPRTSPTLTTSTTHTPYEPAMMECPPRAQSVMTVEVRSPAFPVATLIFIFPAESHLLVL